MYIALSRYFCSDKLTFRKKLETNVKSTFKDNKVIIVGDFNGHVGQKANRFQGLHGGKGFGERNVKGLKLLEFTKAADMTITYTRFKKP